MNLRKAQLLLEGAVPFCIDYNEGILEAEERGEKRGEKRGEERINTLNSYLIRDKRFDDLERSVRDKDFQRQLMSDYGILV